MAPSSGSSSSRGKHGGEELEELREAASRYLRAALPRLESERWYRDKGKRVENVRVVDFARIDRARSGEDVADRTPDEMPLIVLAELTYAENDRAIYLFFLIAERNRSDSGNALHAARARSFAVRAWRDDEPAWRLLLDAILRGERMEGSSGTFEFRCVSRPRVGATRIDAVNAREIRSLGAEQTNTAVVIDDSLLLKSYRRVDRGPQPEIEVLLHCEREGASDVAPRILGSLEYLRNGEHDSRGLAIVEEYLARSSDLWTVALADVGKEIAEESVSSPSSFAEETACRLGNLTARLHIALASLPASDAEEEAVDLAFAFRARVESLATEIDRAHEGAPVAMRPRLSAVVDEARRRLELLPESTEWGKRTRVHGDFHLGQVLARGERLWIVDFEGEPASPPSKRRASYSAVKDIAGMLRSFDYAAAVALAGPGGTNVPALAERARAEKWRAAARSSFVAAWERAMELSEIGRTVLPQAGARARIIELHEIEKALYEVLYELRNRPSFLWVPLEALLGVRGEDR